MYPDSAQTHQKSPVQITQYPAPMQIQPPHGGLPSQWSTGLFDCFDDASNCCLTCCCPCVTFGQIAEIVDKGTTSCGLAGTIYYALSTVGCQCLYTFTFRTKLRGLYSIQEDPCADILVHCCCMGCALCQEFRELKNRGVDPSVGWQANLERMNRGSTVPPTVATGMNR